MNSWGTGVENSSGDTDVGSWGEGLTRHSEAHASVMGLKRANLSLKFQQSEAKRQRTNSKIACSFWQGMYLLNFQKTSLRPFRPHLGAALSSSRGFGSL